MGDVLCQFKSFSKIKSAAQLNCKPTKMAAQKIKISAAQIYENNCPVYK